MAASATDLLRKKRSNFSTTLNGTITDSDTTMTLASVTGLPTDTGITLTLDRVDTNNVSTPSAKERVTGTISGLTVTNLLRGQDNTTALAHTSGAVVEDIWDAETWNDAVAWGLVGHNQDGTHKSGSVLTLPQINDTSSDHQYVVAVSELAADRTVTLPLLGAADEFLFKDHAATMTNKKHTGDFELTAATDNIKINGADPKRGMYIPASAFFPATTTGCGSLSQAESTTNKINYKYLPFDGATEEYAWIDLPTPDWWDLSTVTIKFHWVAPSGTGDVIWGAAGLARSDDDAIDTALGSAVTVTDTVTTALDHQTTAATSAITIGGTPAKGDKLYLRVYRDADAGGDTLNGVDAYLTGITLKYGIGQYDDQ